jgi:hypothetical protein
VEATEVVARRLFVGGGWWPIVGGDSRGTLQLMGGEEHITHDQNEGNNGCGGSSLRERAGGGALVKSGEMAMVSDGDGGRDAKGETEEHCTWLSRGRNGVGKPEQRR